MNETIIPLPWSTFRKDCLLAMKMGFVFNIRFPFYQGQYYAIDLPGEVWNNRYLKYCDTLKVIGRKDQVQDDPSKNLSISSVDRVEFDCVDNETYIKRLFHYWKDSSHISRVITDCDFVVCRGSWGARICRKAGIPYLVEVVGCDWDALWNHSWQGKVAALPRFIALKRAAWHAPYVLYVTKNFLQKRYPSKGIQAGISDVRLKSIDENVLSMRLMRIAGKLSFDKLILGTTAAVDVKYKGQEYVIAALGKLKMQGITGIEYQLVGGGDSNYLKKVAKDHKVSDQVVFKGPLPHHKVFEWLDSIDVYVQPSLQEGLPRAVVEAMSRGCPVFGSNTGGIPELLDPGFIFKRKNINQIAKIIQSFNQTNMVLQAKRSFEKAKEFEPETLDHQRDIFYKEFISNCVTKKTGD